MSRRVWRVRIFYAPQTIIIIRKIKKTKYGFLQKIGPIYRWVRAVFVSGFSSIGQSCSGGGFSIRFRAIQHVMVS